eukprot:2457360-Rhodomonas_salina.2
MCVSAFTSAVSEQASSLRLTQAAARTELSAATQATSPVVVTESTARDGTSHNRDGRHRDDSDRDHGLRVGTWSRGVTRRGIFKLSLPVSLGERRRRAAAAGARFNSLRLTTLQPA